MGAQTRRIRTIRMIFQVRLDLYRQVGEKYFEEHMDYPQAEYIDLFNLIEKLRGDIEILKQEIDGGDDEAAEEDIEDIEE